MDFRVVTKEDERHIEALAVVQREYARHFGSTATHSLEYALNVYLGKRLKATIGFSPAADGQLFLEQYLDAPIEAVVTERFGSPVVRAEIVEIGAFAVADKQFALPLMMKLAPTLMEQGFKTAVCTATGPVTGCLRKLGIDAMTIASADASRVHNPAAWGRYYELQPQVLAGNIAQGVRAIGQCHNHGHKRLALAS